MLDDLLKPAPEQVLKVTELTRHIKSQLESNFKQLWVQGEVSNLRRQSSGHIYFSLKDAGSQLPAVLFARDAVRQNCQLSDGMEVQLFGDLSVYEPHGRYQFIAKIALESGIGKLQVDFERLKRQLAAEGLFDKERKQALPVLPKKIAVITSPTGAALRDFLRILHRRKYAGNVVIFPARVQGRGAAQEMIRMLQRVTKMPEFDLVVLSRGGGSIEDLWAFNEEALARAVAACPLPLISAVGHEIDTVLTDYAADARAETPSGAAELISSLYLNTLQRCQQAHQDLALWADSEITERTRKLYELETKMRLIAPDRQVQHLSMTLDDLENKLRASLRERIHKEQSDLNQHAQALATHHPRLKINLAQQSLNDYGRRLLRIAKTDRNSHQEHLQFLQTRLNNSSLKATLARGYSILKTTRGEIVSSAPEAMRHAELIAQLSDGEILLKNQCPNETKDRVDS